MRVYQFRHIRAPGILAAATGTGMLQGNRRAPNGVTTTMIRVSGLFCALVLCCLPAARGTADVPPLGGPTSEVVVTLASRRSRA